MRAGGGINDAPALARTEIRIALGAAGTTLKNIRQNMVFALATVAFLLAGEFRESVHMAGGFVV